MCSSSEYVTRPESWPGLSFAVLLRAYEAVREVLNVRLNIRWHLRKT